MRKSPTAKHQAVKELKLCIRMARKVARQVNRKLESLAEWNKAKQEAKERLRQLCAIKQ
jgi:hypothetical protein